MEINNEFTVFGRKVELNIKEIAHYEQNNGLTINNGVLEYFLMSNGIFELNDNMTAQELHDLCIASIEQNQNNAQKL